MKRRVAKRKLFASYFRVRTSYCLGYWKSFSAYRSEAKQGFWSLHAFTDAWPYGDKRYMRKK